MSYFIEAVAALMFAFCIITGAAAFELAQWPLVAIDVGCAGWNCLTIYRSVATRNRIRALERLRR